MSRFAIIDPEAAPSAAQSILKVINAQMGFVPNTFRAMAASPVVLEAVTALQNTLAKTLDAKTRNSIALAVSQANGCNYCLAVHGFVSDRVTGMSEEDITLGRIGSSTDPKRAAAARFAHEVVSSRGKVNDAEIAAVRDAGYSDPQILGIVALAVQALMTNYLNNVIDTDIDPVFVQV